MTGIMRAGSEWFQALKQTDPAADQQLAPTTYMTLERQT